MASIEKMSIRGIRAFSPDKDEVIEFYSPLTIIVGANGCGKTTLIEALKFACTGNLPPNCKSGQSFINDPTVTDRAEVKASIKLRFRNKGGELTLVTRLLQVSRKKGKLEFKTLDGAIRTTNPQTHEKSSMSYKCADLDSLVPELLGVSPAILENVIFCHQEDSSWPLSEPLALKKRFDDIFESTRYAYALDALLKTRKIFNDKAKEIKVTLAEYGAHLTSANESKRELAGVKASKAECEEELKSCQDVIDRMDAKLIKYEEVITRCESSVTDLQDMEARVVEISRRVAEKAAHILTPRPESDAELRMLLLNFDQQMEVKVHEQRSLQKEVDSRTHHVSLLRSELGDLNVKRGRAEAVEIEMSQCRVRLAQESTSVVRKYDLQGELVMHERSDKTSRSMTYTSLTGALGKKIKVLESEAEATLRQLRNAVAEHEQMFFNARGDMQKLQIEIAGKKTELSHKTAENDSQRAEMTGLATAKTTQQMAQRDFSDIKEQHDREAEGYSAKTLATQKLIKDCDREIKEINELISEDSALLQELSSKRAELANVAAQERQLDQDEAQVHAALEDAFQTHRTSFNRTTTPAGSSDLAALFFVLESGCRDKRVVVGGLKEQLLKTQQSIAATSALSAQAKDTYRELGIRISDLTGSKDSIIRDCVGDINDMRKHGMISVDFEGKPDLVASVVSIDDLAAAAEDVSHTIEDARNISEASALLYIRAKNLRTKNQGNCPCCLQSIPAELEASYEKSSKKMFRISSESTKAVTSALIERAKGVVEKIKALQRSLQPTDMLLAEQVVMGQRIEEAERNLTQLHLTATDHQSAVLAAESKLVQLEKALTCVSDLKSRLSVLEERRLEVNSRKDRHSRGGLSMGDPGGRSIEEMEEAQRERQERKDLLQAKKDKMFASETIASRSMARLKDDLSAAEKALNDAGRKAQRFLELEANSRNSSAVIEQLNQNIKAFVKREAELTARLSQVEAQWHASKEALRAKEETCAELTTGLKSSLLSVENIWKVFVDLETRLTAEDLPGLLRRLVEIDSTISAKESDIQNYKQRIAAIAVDISSQENVRRQVQDNLALRELKSQEASLKASLEEMRNKSGKYVQELEDARRDSARAGQEKSKMASKRDKLGGSLEVYDTHIKGIQDKLLAPTYRDIEQRYKRKNIEYETTVMTVTDLATYYDALDKALQNFHALKIKEVNKIIRELWQLIYRGQDIDMIEIESGQEGAPTASAAEAKRRVYSYRVVMRKGNVPLDMRGRCSAGQRVLAAIVIRLALAETFCLSCGMLALDEPTTNLDDGNKRSLAHALARIIVNRSRQNNFQLICITHDEEFVSVLNSELSAFTGFHLPEYYFRVSREEVEDGAGRGAGESGIFFSKIERIDWGDM